MHCAEDLEHILSELLLFSLPVSHRFFSAFEQPKFLIRGLL